MNQIKFDVNVRTTVKQLNNILKITGNLRSPNINTYYSTKRVTQLVYCKPHRDKSKYQLLYFAKPNTPREEPSLVKCEQALEIRDGTSQITTRLRKKFTI